MASNEHVDLGFWFTGFFQGVNAIAAPQRDRVLTACARSCLTRGTMSYSSRSMATSMRSSVRSMGWTGWQRRWSNRGARGCSPSSHAPARCTRRAM